METLEFLYNTAHGGYSFSENLYKEYDNLDWGDYEGRFDKKIISVVREYHKAGKRYSGIYADIQISSVTFPKQINPEYVKQSIKLNEYDGSERPNIDKPLLLKIMIDKREFKTIEELYEMNKLIGSVQIKMKLLEKKDVL